MQVNNVLNYNKFSYKLSREIERRPSLLKLYKHFCYNFLKPKDLNLTPIFINNRNHYTYLRDLINWLKRNDFSNFYVIDYDSDYPPLLEYYKKELTNRVIFLHKNAGHLAFWNESIMHRVKNSFYIYTDSDILPVLEENKLLIANLYTALKDHSFALKAGCAIKINDLPDHYNLKKNVIEHEQKFWQHQLNDHVYLAGVDTTLALYLPNYYWDYRYWDKHIRVSGDCIIRHQPWYCNSNDMTTEQLHYKNNSRAMTHWTNFESSPHVRTSFNDNF